MFCACQIHKHHGLSALAKRSFHVLFEGENYRKFPRSSVSSDVNFSGSGYSGSDRSDSGFSGSVSRGLNINGSSFSGLAFSGLGLSDLPKILAV